MRLTYRHTLLASYLGYITQAIVVNLATLLFVTFQTTFSITTGQIALLISFNFGTQIVTDIIASRVIDKTGFRVPIVMAHVSAVVGLVLMAVLPGLIDPYAGLLTATFFMAVGGGLTEVLISPIVEALPGEEKASAMSLLHSFYSWGLVCVVLVSTAFFAVFGIENWRWLPILWMLVPLFNTFLFAKVPLKQLVDESERMSAGALFKKGIFWLLLLLMVCAGAAEQGMSQWASLFAELGLGVDKSVGDLLGPCAFAVMMGIMRTFYGVMGSRIKLKRAMLICAALCVATYLVTIFAPTPIMSLVGCAVTGLAVGLMWPGTLSLSAAVCPYGGATMFAILAVAGDLGCTIGPALVGEVAGAVERGMLTFSGATGAQAGLRLGLLAAIVFPVVLFVGISFLGRKRKTEG